MRLKVYDKLNEHAMQARQSRLRGFTYHCPTPDVVTVWAQVSHGAIQFMVYEELKERATRPTGGAQRAPPSSAEITAIGAVSKLAASVATYPSQARPSPCA